MNMIERVARALHKSNWPNSADGDIMWKFYVKDARAAIAAMREPTEAMRYAGIMEHHRSSTTCEPEPSTNAYRTMIDAALNS